MVTTDGCEAEVIAVVFLYDSKRGSTVLFCTEVSSVLRIGKEQETTLKLRGIKNYIQFERTPGCQTNQG